MGFALLLTVMPIPDWMEPFWPNWVVLGCVYWAIAFPQSYSLGCAWILGLILDVAHGALLGQNALAMSAVIYFTVRFHLLFRQFPLPQLIATVFGLLILYQFILFWTNGVTGIHSDMVFYWGPVVSGAIIWPAIAAFLARIRQRTRW